MRGERLALAAALGALALAALATASPGVFSVDEVGYQWMIRSAAQGEPLSIWNGYLERPSPELELRYVYTIFERGGRLVGKYPQGFPWLAAPLYALMGIRGAIALNAAGWAISAALTWAIGRELSEDRRLPWLAVLTFAAGTYSYQYAQAIWPHASALAFGTGAFYCGLRARRAEGPVWAAGAGLLVGAGMGMRLDVLLMLGPLLLLSLSRRPYRPAHTAALALGCAPGLALLSLVNYRKLGLLWPLSYHPALSSPPSAGRIALGAGLLLAAVVGRWLLDRPAIAARLAGRWWTLGLACVALGAAGVLAATRTGLWETLQRCYILLADLRVIDGIQMDVPPSPDGVVIYRGFIKKGLLQSCPYLAALSLPLLAALGGRARARRLWPLWLPVITWCLLFGRSAWHGGQCLNLRYLLPIFPATSVLFAWTLLELAGPLRRRWWVAAAAAGAALAGAYLALHWPWPAAGAVERRLLLDFPLQLAAGAGALAALSLRARGGELLRGAALIAAALGLSWAALIAGLYDLRGTRSVREANLALAEEMSPHIRDDSLVFMVGWEAFAGLLERDRVRLAMPTQDDFADMPALARYHLEAGRPVYAALPQALWQHIDAEAVLRGLRTEGIGEAGGGLFELRRIERIRGGP